MVFHAVNKINYEIFIYLFIYLFIGCKGNKNKEKTDITIYPINNNVSRKISKQWIGSFEGSFLRLQGESRDSRGWATVDLKILENQITFQLSSYVEENSFELVLIKQQVDSITFKMKNDTIKNTEVYFYKKNNEYILKSLFIDDLIHKKELIKMTRITNLK